ncbi:hypothetical protein Droror1_Dr00027808 [Drosera rotundifolia]
MCSNLMYLDTLYWSYSHSERSADESIYLYNEKLSAKAKGLDMASLVMKQLATTIENAGFEVDGLQEQNVVVCRLRIKEMACTRCSDSLAGALASAHGVKRAVVSLAPEEAMINFDSHKTNVNQIIEAVEGAGFGAVLINLAIDANIVNLKVAEHC